MAYDPDKIIEIATALKAAKDEVLRLEAELRKIVLSQTSPAGLVTQLATAMRVINLLNSEPAKSFSAEDVWTKLNIKESYARPLLSRLVNDRKIEKRGRGEYGALGSSKQKGLELESRPLQ